MDWYERWALLATESRAQRVAAGPDGLAAASAASVVNRPRRGSGPADVVRLPGGLRLAGAGLARGARFTRHHELRVAIALRFQPPVHLLLLGEQALAFGQVDRRVFAGE